MVLTGHTSMSKHLTVPAAGSHVSEVEMTCSVIQTHPGSQRSQNTLVLLFPAYPLLPLLHSYLIFVGQIIRLIVDIMLTKLIC